MFVVLKIWPVSSHQQWDECVLLSILPNIEYYGLKICSFEEFPNDLAFKESGIVSAVAWV